jgi:O-antigen ligase
MARETGSSILRDPFRLFLMALLVQTVSKIGSFLGPMQKMRPALFLFAFALLAGLANFERVFNRDLLKWTVPRLIIAQGIVACASAVFGISLGHAALFIVNSYWKTIVFAFMLMTSLRNVEDVRRTAWATAMGGFILCFLGLFITGLAKDGGGVEMYDPNDVGTIIVTTLPIGLLVFQTSKGRGRVISLVGLGLLAAALVKTQSRGAFIGAACVGIALLLFLPGVAAWKRLLSLGTIIATMTIYAPPGYWEAQKKVILDPKSDYNWDAEDGRRKLAKRGIGYMMQYPVFGVGIDNFAMAEGTISPYAQSIAHTTIGLKWSAPHNSWIEAGSETGVSGLVIWAALLVGSAGGLLRLRKRMPKEWANSEDGEARFLYLATAYIPIAFLGFLVAATFVSFSWSDQAYILPALAMGVQIAYLDKTRRAPRSASAPAVLRGGRRLRVKPA